MSDRASPPSEQTAQIAQRLLALADACVLCGLCLPHCPTYRLDAHEAESPRGRVVLAQALARDPAGFDDSGAEALDHCLGCGRCEQVCPAKVRFGELIRLSRRLLPPRRKSLGTRVVLWASQRPQVFASILNGLRPLRYLLPRQARHALDSSGRGPSQPASSRRVRLRLTQHARQAQRMHEEPERAAQGSLRIGLLTGCVARSLEASALHAAVRLLQACGHHVFVPAEQACCGALDQHADRGAHTAALAESNLRAWGAHAVDLFVATASGCQGAYAATLQSMAPTTDVMQMLANDDAFAQIALRRIELRAALHLPCTQRGLPGSVEATRALLSRIPGLELMELADTGCCGAAGAHMLQFPQRAAALRQPLLDTAIASRATTLLSANIGCRLHLAGAAELAGIRIRHPLELLAEALP